MNVQLIGNTYAIEPDILKHIENVNFLQNDTATITTAAKQCYNKEFDYKEFFKKYTENKEANELFIKRIAERYDVSEKKALDRIKRMDRERKYYYETHTGQEWGSISSHEILLNASLLGIEGTVDILEGIYKR